MAHQKWFICGPYLWILIDLFVCTLCIKNCGGFFISLLLKTILKLSTVKVGGDKRTWEDYLHEHKVENRLFFLLVDSAAVTKGHWEKQDNN